eukprot:CAMPEP_0170486864 /NCGR_PEP_ID=MMETSP0208-20121228/5790_1 /TAXON_ID=197538 /ORGANISM="Strombidium inclinatum, Strain S3" /LENGTH=106 /DNA_ID=CAMNT_0010760943 /DNA_START=2857 /DNA_END=3177 /DNA_ORIENTATION=+
MTAKDFRAYENKICVDDVDGEIEPGYPRILIVDDQVFNIEAIKVILRADNIDLNNDIQEAYNGQQALDLVKERTAANMFHIIFMDCNMPFMDGCTSTSLIRDFINE